MLGTSALRHCFELGTTFISSRVVQNHKLSCWASQQRQHCRRQHTDQLTRTSVLPSARPLGLIGLVRNTRPHCTQHRSGRRPGHLSESGPFYLLRMPEPAWQHHRAAARSLRRTMCHAAVCAVTRLDLCDEPIHVPNRPNGGHKASQDPFTSGCLGSR